MKKSSLTTAVVAGIVGVAGLANVATAMNINPDGLGQVLIYPYYTVNKGQATLLSVVNTTDEVKAVKVRFLEGRNSREVLDFNLYLSPWDVWTGMISDAGNTSGPARLFSDDTSCIAPRQLGAEGEAFRNFEYSGSKADGGPAGLDRTREGHIEMIEMGVVGNGQPSANLADAATHITLADGSRVPENCGAIRTAWATGGVWATAPVTDDDVAPPTGGLFGGASIVNVANGTGFSYNADAIEGFYAVPGVVDSPLHARPGSVSPSLANAQDDLDGPGSSRAVIFDNGTLVTQSFDTARFRAVSALFMHNEIYNEYNTQSALAAASEWVVTFPTKRLHLESGSAANKRPFTSTFGSSGACEPIEISFYDREETEPGDQPEDIDFSPEPPDVTAPGLNLCFEAQVVTFNQPTLTSAGSAVLGARYASNINLCKQFEPNGTCTDGDVFSEGWVRLQLGNRGLEVGTADPATLTHFLVDDDLDGDTFHNLSAGLPVTGFWVANYVNANAAPGMLSNFSGIHKHRADREGYTVTPNTAGTGFIGVPGEGSEWEPWS